MRKTIALIELAFHNEVLASYCRILDAAGFSLMVFTNPFNQKQLADLAVDVVWNIKKEGESIIDYVFRVKASAETADLIIFTTIEKNFHFFTKPDFKVPRLLVIHKMNMFLDPSKSFRFDSSFKQNLKDLLKICRFYLLREKARNLRFIQSFDGVIFPSRQVSKYLVKKGWDVFIPPQIVMDFAIHEILQYDKVGEPSLTVSIPGIVSEKSRDYQVVIKALRKLQFTVPIKLILLGTLKGNYGRRVLRELESLQGIFFEVISYNEFVPQAEFEDVLRRSVFLILPMTRFPKISIFREINGYTCVSGNINDLLHFGTPALIPNYYPIDSGMKDLVESYGNADQLALKIHKWIVHKTYLLKRNLKPGQLSPFTSEAIAELVKNKLIEFMK